MPPREPEQDRGEHDARVNPRTGLFRLGEVQWDNLIKRYVWDDDTTPYLVAVSRLTRRQAGFELTAYAIFLGFLFGVAAVITLSPQAPGGRSMGMSLYSLSIVFAAVLLGMTRHYWAALYCSTAPAGMLLWIYVFAGHPGLSPIDDLVIIVFAALWVRYGLRVNAIARGHDAMPEGEMPARTRRGWGRRR